jgi:flavin-dependent dehydrogenase
MTYADVIIVGGGPAGSSCAWKLKQHGFECIILDKQEFPRPKLCAGWIQPRVIADLQIDLNEYPYGLTKFDLFHVHIYNKDLKLKVRQYAIRRDEFDHWLLKRCSAVPVRHEVKDIKKNGTFYILDDQYQCKFLVGAGGTHCPVHRIFFESYNPRHKEKLIVSLEEEFPYEYRDNNCHLWFMQNELPGYSWYVPKNNGFVNVGIGGYAEKLKAQNKNIKDHWQLFIGELQRSQLIDNYDFKTSGYTYYIRNNTNLVQIDNSFIIGDAAGLATQDMGEGIGPAVQSGLLAAESIINGKSLSFKSIKKYSFPRWKTAVKLLLRR